MPRSLDFTHLPTHLEPAHSFGKQECPIIQCNPLCSVGTALCVNYAQPEVRNLTIFQLSIFKRRRSTQTIPALTSVAILLASCNCGSQVWWPFASPNTLDNYFFLTQYYQDRLNRRYEVGLDPLLAVCGYNHRGKLVYFRCNRCSPLYSTMVLV